MYLRLCNFRKFPTAHSSRTLLRGRYKIPAVLKKEPRQSKSFSSRKIVLLCLVRISPSHTARKLHGQNPERKMSFPFSKEISPPPNQKCKECFFFRGCRAERGSGGAFIG
ncbi:MAG: hypothetical protein DDT18_01343 [Actinobacteria bacterium]|nr:hypothetical protein [Actinomycetota bacterium]